MLWYSNGGTILQLQPQLFTFPTIQNMNMFRIQGQFVDILA